MSLSSYQDKGPPSAPTTSTSVPSTGHTAADGAAAPGQEGGFFAGPMMLIMMVALVVFMFWSSSRQRKKQQALIASLKRGDRVLTQSGIVGRIDELEDRYARLEIAPGVKIRVLRSSLAGKDGTPEAAVEATRKA